jgi:hypothetical protein
MKRALTLIALMLTPFGCAGPQQALLPPGKDPETAAALVAHAGNYETALPGTDSPIASSANAGTGTPARKPTPVLDATLDTGGEVVHAIVVAGVVVLVVGLIVGVALLYGVASSHQLPAGI